MKLFFSEHEIVFLNINSLKTHQSMGNRQAQLVGKPFYHTGCMDKYEFSMRQ